MRFVDAFLVDAPEWGGYRLAVAPHCSVIKEGDLVMMEGDIYPKKALCDSVSVEEKGEEIRLLKKMSHGGVLKAVGRYHYKEYEWEVNEDE